MANDSAKYRFEKNLTELPAGLQAPARRRRHGRRLALLLHLRHRGPLVPRPAHAGPPITRREAQKTLILRHLQNVVAATRNEVFKALDVLGWTKGEFEGAVGCLVEEGRIKELQVDWSRQSLLVAVSE